MTTLYKSVNLIGADMTKVGTDKLFDLGTVARIKDPTNGLQGEAIYVKSSDAILEGSLVDYQLSLGTAILAPATGGTGPCGVALAAIPSGSYGWVQVEGSAVVKAPNAMVVGAEVWMLAATPGSIDDTLVAGEQILNAKVETTTGTPSAGFARININRPFHQGNIT